MKKQNKCCFCGKKYDNYGNNPEPYNYPNGRCCNDCDEKNVIPARLFMQRYWMAIDGDISAQWLMGECFYRGGIVEQDYDEAEYWYNSAAEQGDENAKKALKELFNY